MNLSDLFTSISILIAAATFLAARRSDQTQRKQEQAERNRQYADGIRTAASITLSRVDRCQRIFSSLFQQAQPLITQIDGQFIETKNVVRCRDEFWKELYKIHNAVLLKFDDEQVELSYAPLMGYQADIYALFVQSIATAKASYTLAFSRFVERSQQTILGIDPKREAVSAVLGNQLRGVATLLDYELELELRNALAELSTLLKTIVRLNDEAIRNPKTISNIVGTRGGAVPAARTHAEITQLRREFEEANKELPSCRLDVNYLQAIQQRYSHLARDEVAAESCEIRGTSILRRSNSMSLRKHETTGIVAVLKSLARRTLVGGRWKR